MGDGITLYSFTLSAIRRVRRKKCTAGVSTQLDVFFEGKNNMVSCNLLVSANPLVYIGLVHESVFEKGDHCSHVTAECHYKYLSIWRFPKMWVPPNHPFYFGIFHYKPFKHTSQYVRQLAAHLSLPMPIHMLLKMSSSDVRIYVSDHKCQLTRQLVTEQIAVATACREVPVRGAGGMEALQLRIGTAASNQPQKLRLSWEA